MRATIKLFKYSVLLAAILILSPSNASAWWWNRGPQCDDVAYRDEPRHINVLTFNILFFAERFNAEERLGPIVDFLFNQNELGEPVDLILLQEVVGGYLAFSDFTNSARRLKELLSEIGLEYNLRTAFEVGLPGLFYTGNAILSRCEIKFSLVKRLPRESEIEILGRAIKLPRNVQMARLKIPGYGKFNAYNTHLCAGCAADEREQQLEVLFDFMDAVENFIPGKDPILLAGDFNIDRFRNEGDEFLYDTIISEGFVDAYAEGVPGGLSLDELCPNKDFPDEHCTVGNTYFDFIEQGNGRRIDYVFRKGFEGTSFAEVFFNNRGGDPPVSDHSAVFVRIELP